mmetsp:Transcript_6739/g.16908  ORF Transcript_6739/g.16908 Transcript_6739/m.16908 type:complete len:368 (+) Transcript_6739:310-1413(+)
MEGLVVDTVWFNDFKKELPAATNKVVVITGTTSGTGFVAARTAGELGAEVVLLNRPSDRATKALDGLRAAVPSATFVPIDCDLQNFDSVKVAATKIKEKYNETGIYCVCWNAGIMATPDKATTDGYDTQMQTNHLSHFLLTAELFPLIEKYATSNGDARIVSHSSGARHMTPDNCLERKYFEKNGGNLGGDEMTGGFSGGPFLRYFQSKLANAVFTQALHQKLLAKGSTNVKSVCADPGMSATSLGNHFSDDAKKACRLWPNGCKLPKTVRWVSSRVCSVRRRMLRVVNITVPPARKVLLLSTLANRTKQIHHRSICCGKHLRMLLLSSLWSEFEFFRSSSSSSILILFWDFYELIHYESSIQYCRI